MCSRTVVPALAWVLALAGVAIVVASEGEPRNSQGTRQPSASASTDNSAPTKVGPAIGYFEASADIGSPAIAGATTYDAVAQTYTMSGGGTNMWLGRDEFQFVWRKMTGDFTVRTHVTFAGAGVDPHRKIGVIIRRTLEADSPYVDAVRHGDGLTSLQRRESKGGPTLTTTAEISLSSRVKFVRF